MRQYQHGGVAFAAQPASQSASEKVQGVGWRPQTKSCPGAYVFMCMCWMLGLFSFYVQGFPAALCWHSRTHIYTCAWLWGRNVLISVRNVRPFCIASSRRKWFCPLRCIKSSKKVWKKKNGFFRVIEMYFSEFLHTRNAYKNPSIYNEI